MASCLVVDDSAVVCGIAADILRSFGHEVDEARGVEAAIDRCRAGVDVVLLDWDLPSLGALDFLREAALLAEEADPAYEGIVAGLARVARGVVVAGTEEDGRSGRLSRLRESDAVAEVATVDGIDHTTGVVTSVLALGSWPDARGGAFGASGDDGTVPIG